MPHVMRRLNHQGDSEINWEPDDSRTLAFAKAIFETHVHKDGGMAYLVPSDPRQESEIIRKFDPNAEEIILAPRLVGG